MSVKQNIQRTVAIAFPIIILCLILMYTVILIKTYDKNKHFRDCEHVL